MASTPSMLRSAIPFRNDLNKSFQRKVIDQAGIKSTRSDEDELACVILIGTGSSSSPSYEGCEKDKPHRFGPTSF